MLALGGIWAIGSPSDTPEDRIRKALDQIEEGVQSARLSMIMETISLGYTDDDGLTRDSLSRFLMIQFQKRGPISATFTPIDIRVDQDRARCEFGVILAESERESIIGWPVNAEMLDFKVDFRLEEGEWRIVSHSRQPVFQ